MLVVVAIIATMSALVYPSVGAGLETLRLNQAAGSVIALFNEALGRADRRQQVVEVTVLARERRLTLRSTDPRFQRNLELPQNIAILSIQPGPPEPDPDGVRQFVLYPGGAPPRIAIELGNARGSRRIVRIDPITGSPRIERPGK
jgi:type II secretory pathway pseudopilin PulG